MSGYAYLLEQLREAEASVSELEAALAREPGDRALEVDLLSARHSARAFHDELLAQGPTQFFDVCRYRIDPVAEKAFSINSVADSLKGFQGLFTLIFHAITSRKPRRVARVPLAVAEESELGIGYTFAGSLGIVLTIDSSKTLFNARFDDTIAALLNLVEIKDQSDVRESAQRLGMAVVRQAYEWANKNYSSAYNIDLKWRNANMIETGKYIDRSDFVRIVDNIGMTSDVTKEIIEIDGILAGGDILTKKFHFVDDEDRDYRGALSANFLAETVELGRRYKARLLVEGVLRYALEEEERSYTLLSLHNEKSA